MPAAPSQRADQPQRADQRATRRQYDRWARVYDAVWSGYVEATNETLLAAAHLRPGERVLNVGCGTGAFEARVLRERPGQPVTGVDLSGRMLAAARAKTRRAPHARFVQGAAQALPFADAAFDVAVSASVLHYVARPATALREMARVVRPGSGRVVVLDWCRDFAAMRLLDAVLRRLDPAHGRTLAQAELHALLQAAGLASVRGRRLRRRGWWGLMVAQAQRPAA